MTSIGGDPRSHQEDQRLLLSLARSTIRRSANGQPLEKVVPPSLSEWLRTPLASFVTLTIEGGLRGCIGGLYPTVPLIEDVQIHAHAAAREDPRFPPVRPEEVPTIRIEVSVLSSPTPLQVRDPDDLIRLLRPEVDGVILQSGWRRATFLPQVWEKVPSPEAFLLLLCEKAGLPPDAWRAPDTEIFTYQVEKFEEEGPLA